MKINLLLPLLLIALLLTGLAASAQPNENRPLRIIAFGAHPDDAELKVGGVAAMWAAQGHKVKFVAMTNGDIGHFEMAGGPLAIRREKEVQECARLLNLAKKRNEDVANQYRDRLLELYGPQKGKQIRYAEAFELCQYGRQPSLEELKKLFPGLGK